MYKLIEFDQTLVLGYTSVLIKEGKGKLIYNGPDTAAVELYFPSVILVGKENPFIAIGDEKNISELENLLRIEGKTLNRFLSLFKNPSSS